MASANERKRRKAARSAPNRGTREEELAIQLAIKAIRRGEGVNAAAVIIRTAFTPAATA